MDKIKIKILSREGRMALVEYLKGKDQIRVSLKQNKISPDHEVTLEDLQAGIPYGMDWEALVNCPALTGLNYEMRRRDIWTLQDALAHSELVRAAVIAATKNIVKTIVSGGI